MRDLAKLKVCLVAGTLGQGGAERQLYYILRALVELGAVPRVLCLTRGEFWEDRIKALGVPIIWVGQSQSRFRRLWRIISELRRNRPDVLQSQHFYTNIYVGVAARLLGIPDIGALRSDCISEVAANSRVLGLLSLRLPRTVAANSQTAIANAAAFGKPSTSLRLLPNVVDTARFKVRELPASDSIRLLTVGRLVPVKRFDRFLRVFAMVREQAGVPVHATIVGDGPLRSDLEALATQLGLNHDCLVFYGAAAMMLPHYQAAHIFVLTSDLEGTPNVVLEAMAMGLPVVATRVGGMPDLLPDATAGSLFDPSDENGLAKAILALIRQPALREAHAAKARSIVEQQYATRHLGRHLQLLYDAALGIPHVSRP